MAYAKDIYSADGTTQKFAVTFPFISRSHVSVTVDGTAATFTWDNDARIDITTPTLSGGEEVIIKRASSPATRLVDYVDGANLTETDLDTDSKQSFYLAQENIDEAGQVGFPDLDDFSDTADASTAGDILVADGTEYTNVTVTGDVTINSSGVTAIGTGKVTSTMILDGTIVDADINASAGIDASKIADGSVSDTEFQYLNGVTSAIQTQIDNITAGTLTTIDDDNFTLQDNGDTTKKLQFQASGITTGTTRTLTAPDADTTIVGTDVTQTLTNKTLTSPTLDTPTLNDPLFDVSVGNTANTNSSQGDNPITSFFYEIAVCANAGDAVTLPAAAAGKALIVANNGANSADVFPASGDNIDGAGVDVAKALAPGSNTLFMCQDGTDWDTLSGGSVNDFTGPTDVTGTKNGSNTAFTVANHTGSIQVFKNNILLQEGVGKDYTISVNNITMAVAPESTDELFYFYFATGSAVNPLTINTKGDLLTYTTTQARLGVGTDGQTLLADSAQSAGIKWGEAGYDAGVALPTNYIGGLAISNNGTDGDHDIDIAVGMARDYGDAANLVLSSALTKQIDVAWAVGTNAGGIDTGAVAADTGYGVYLIRRSDTGVVDVLFSTDMSAAGSSVTMPTNYDQKRLIGWVHTDSSANIYAFLQSGDYFRLTGDIYEDVNDSTITDQTWETLTTEVPPLCIWEGYVYLVNTTTSQGNAVIGLRTTGAADVGYPSYDESYLSVFDVENASSGHKLATAAHMLTNSSGQIDYNTIEAGGTPGSASIIINTIGVNMLTRSHP